MDNNRSGSPTGDQRPSPVAHTPGPWIGDAGEVTGIRASDGGRICSLGWLRGRYGIAGRREESEVLANAALIAAAPELLDVLKAVDHTLCVHGHIDADTDLHEAIQRVIRKSISVMPDRSEPTQSQAVR